MYPAANQATVVLHALENELKRQKVEVKLEEAVLSDTKRFQKKRWLCSYNGSRQLYSKKSDRCNRRDGCSGAWKYGRRL